MNIRKIFIAHSWSDVGVNIQTKAVAKKLSDSTKVVYLTQARIGKPELRVNNKLRVAEWPSKRPNSIKDFFFICKKIIRERPDVFIAHFGATNISMIAAWLLRVKYRVCWLHTMTEQFYFDVKDKSKADKIIRLKKRIYALATHIVVLNEYGRKDAEMNYSIPAKKIFKIHNGINLGTITNDRKYKSIRYSGRLYYSKGVDILIEAFSKVYQKDKELKLEIAGKGEEEEHLKALVRSEQLDEAVIFHGYFDQYANAIKFISEAWCLVVPSRMDNFPAVILEALAAGVPVIASNTGGIPDMIDNAIEGYIAESENAEAFAEAIKKMTDNCELRNRMAVQARKTFEQEFSIDKHVNNVMELIDNLK